jgi:hypothetical protein
MIFDFAMQRTRNIIKYIINTTTTEKAIITSA